MVPERNEKNTNHVKKGPYGGCIVTPSVAPANIVLLIWFPVKQHKKKLRQKKHLLFLLMGPLKIVICILVSL